MELLLRVAGFARWEIHGDFDRRPLTRANDSMVVTAWNEWQTFIKAQGDVLAAIDFTTVEVWTKGGLVTYYRLFVMELKHAAFTWLLVRRHEGDDYVKQVARNLTDPCDGFCKDSKYVLMDRDTNFSA